jgi:hypothetical protein
MVNAAKVYRKEDIQAMSEMAVNAGWGPRGAATYDIWLYKGGGNCHHYWVRKTYRAVDVQPDVKTQTQKLALIKQGERG